MYMHTAILRWCYSAIASQSILDMYPCTSLVPNPPQLGTRLPLYCDHANHILIQLHVFAKYTLPLYHGFLVYITVLNPNNQQPRSSHRYRHRYLGVSNPGQPLEGLPVLPRGVDQEEFCRAGHEGTHPDGKITILWSNDGAPGFTQGEV